MKLSSFQDKEEKEKDRQWRQRRSRDVIVQNGRFIIHGELVEIDVSFTSACRSLSARKEVGKKGYQWRREYTVEANKELNERPELATSKLLMIARLFYASTVAFFAFPSIFMYMCTTYIVVYFCNKLTSWRCQSWWKRCMLCSKAKQKTLPCTFLFVAQRNSDQWTSPPPIWT